MFLIKTSETKHPTLIYSGRESFCEWIAPQNNKLRKHARLLEDFHALKCFIFRIAQTVIKLYLLNKWQRCSIVRGRWKITFVTEKPDGLIDHG